MTDPQPSPKVSNTISPLAVIVVVILIGILVVAMVKRSGNHETASGVKVPMAAESSAVMPHQSNVSNTPAPRANTNDGAEAAAANAQ